MNQRIPALLAQAQANPPAIRIDLEKHPLTLGAMRTVSTWRVPRSS